MTDFLTIADIPIPVLRGQAAETVQRIGTSSRTYTGDLRSTVRAEKRTWKVTTKPLLSAVIATIRTAIANAAHVSCAGNMLGGTVTCEVEITDAPYTATKSSDGLSFLRSLVLSIVEV